MNSTFYEDSDSESDGELINIDQEQLGFECKLYNFEKKLRQLEFRVEQNLNFNSNEKPMNIRNEK